MIQPVMPVKAELIIRPMLPADTETVAAIEEASFASPWTREDFLEDQQRPEYCFLVAEVQKKITGYVGVRIVLDEAEITTIAVREDARNSGIGRKLLRELKAVCRKRGVSALYLEVRESNAAARHLYESEGFWPNGRRKNYYQKPAEDALIMTAVISDSSFH